VRTAAERNDRKATNFHPKMYIGIGLTRAYFTLRENYMHEWWVGGSDGYMAKEVRSFHHFNLSQDADEAYAKAAKAAKDAGLELHANPERMKEEMREIKRADATEMHDRRVQYAKEQNDWAAHRDWWLMLRLVENSTRVMGGGKHEGKTPAEINKFDRDYLVWMANNTESAYADTALRALRVETFLENNEPALITIDDYYGSIGKRVELPEMLVVTNFVTESEWGGFNVIKMVGPAGHRFTTFYSGYKFDPKVGETVNIKATIKKHDEYKGETSTIINRVAAVAAKEAA